MLPLVKIKLIKVDNDEKSVTEDSHFHLNLSFKFKRLEFQLPATARIQREDKAKADDKNIWGSLEADRKMLTEAVIVRVMKMKRTLSARDLISEVVQNLSSRFVPGIKMIKSCIENLISKQYLARIQGQRNTFKYLA